MSVPMTARLDVSDPAIAEAIIKVRSDAHEETFCLLGYEGKSKIVLKSCGTGSAYSVVDEMAGARNLTRQAAAQRPPLSAAAVAHLGSGTRQRSGGLPSAEGSWGV